MRTRMFIGSSSEQLHIAQGVQENIERDFETVIWTQNVFKASHYFLEALLNNLDQSDYGIFVLAPDDLTSLRGKNFRYREIT